MAISFINDYSEGGHERLLEALMRTNREQLAPYGLDSHSLKAKEYIARHLGEGERQIHFLTGGTQTNLTLISAALRPHQGALAAESGHINCHETGAIEACGHKVLSLPSEDGKITAAQVEGYCQAHYADGSAEHIVQPGMVYISHPTELGTIYTLSELTALRHACDRWGLILYLDGARLGCALMAKGTDVTMADIARLTDAFCIGGTKMGALCGEALVLSNDALKRDFRYIIKQKGAMLAKGRVTGVQFEELFRDGLYFELAAHALDMAERVARGLENAGIELFQRPVTNQVFAILDRRAVLALQPGFEIGFWQGYDDARDVMRICTSWATEERNVTSFIAKISKI